MPKQQNMASFSHFLTHDDEHCLLLYVLTFDTSEFIYFLTSSLKVLISKEENKDVDEGGNDDDDYFSSLPFLKWYQA